MVACWTLPLSSLQRGSGTGLLWAGDPQKGGIPAWVTNPLADHPPGVYIREKMWVVPRHSFGGNICPAQSPPAAWDEPDLKTNTRRAQHRASLRLLLNPRRGTGPWRKEGALNSGRSEGWGRESPSSPPNPHQGCR